MSIINVKRILSHADGKSCDMFVRWPTFSFNCELKLYDPVWNWWWKIYMASEPDVQIDNGQSMASAGVCRYADGFFSLLSIFYPNLSIFTLIKRDVFWNLGLAQRWTGLTKPASCSLAKGKRACCEAKFAHLSRIGLGHLYCRDKRLPFSRWWIETFSLCVALISICLFIPESLHLHSMGPPKLWVWTHCWFLSWKRGKMYYKMHLMNKLGRISFVEL